MLYICISKISLPYFLHVSLNHSTCFVFFIIKFRSIGARKRIFSAVLAEWDTICENERIGKGTIIMGQPSSATANKDLKETIIDVNPEARSTLLELQAERFRKLEEANWNTLQRKISLSIKQAHREQDNRAIVQAQEVIGAKNDDLKRLRQK